ncbi:rhodanese-like domain-containing protein [Limnohabitans sp.]|jgi:rhodanese-related sulfurtransferase|uniref:rhodanese-like domain-containing protein n=1 Tax=Limnohabitans sp. TaxID=1907725 RepID=UPI00289C97AD|nr:rhodanese-like domain-containing protein [Limnohabitans sp.]
MTKFRFFAFVFLIAAALALQACSPEAALPNVSLEQARAEHEAGKVLMIDIREQQEHATGVAQGVVLLPMSQVAQRVAEIPKRADQPVLLICNTQNRSRAVTEALKEQGFTNIRYVNGGMSEWTKRGWPMVKPQDLLAPGKS